jgi:hypothetical protein
MSAAEKSLDHDRRPDPLTVFELRAWARARLYAENLLELGEAVDVLQTAAARDGLIDQFGQEAIQQIMACAFGGTR